ncbi:MAG: hypothetical protein K6G22_06440 [Lachnospiraceae bacterium]|nr:hypothetical protein [Lachnospiraceae bacterium]
MFAGERAYRTADELSDDDESSEEDDQLVYDIYYLQHDKVRDSWAEAFTILNEEREKQGLSPLLWDQELEWAAFLRAYEIAVVFSDSHTRPNGVPWYTINGRRLLGENEYMGKKNAAEAMSS